MHAEEEVHVEDAEDAGRAVGALGIHWFSEWLESSVVKRLAANGGGLLAESHTQQWMR